MTPFVLRRKKLQVLQELPKKYETIKFCDMTPTQRQLYRDCLHRSKGVLTGTAPATEADPQPIANLDEEDDEDKPKGRARVKKEPTVKKKSILKTADNSSNVLMDLRKASNHPMLFRRLFDDKTIRAMSKDCLKEVDFINKDPEYIYEDMSVMTDYELHRFVGPYKVSWPQYAF